MNWQTIHVDFSIFQTDEWKTIYCQGDKNKLILLSYQSIDLISICMLAKKNCRIDSMSPFMPTFICNQTNPINISSNFIFNEFKYSEMVAICEKELNLFKLSQKQIVSSVLIKSHNEQISNRYLPHDLSSEFTEFFFIKKAKENQLLDYFNFMNDKDISLIRKYHGVVLAELVNEHNDILFSKNLSSIRKFIKAPQNAFYFSMAMNFGYKELELFTYQYNFVNSNIDKLIKENNTIDLLYQCVHFYEPIFLFHNKLVISIIGYNHLINNKGKPIGYYHDDCSEQMNLQFKINRLRAEILSKSDQPNYLSDVFSHLKFLKIIHPHYKDASIENAETISLLGAYLTNFHNKYPFFEQTNQMVTNIYN